MADTYSEPPQAGPHDDHVYDLVVLYEHPKWQRPLFAALEARGVDFVAVNLSKGVVSSSDIPRARVIYNQASPSAYVRGNTRAVPFCLTLLEMAEVDGVSLVNGPAAFRFELNKAVQSRVLSRAGIDTPKTLAFNDTDHLAARAHEIGFPAMLKPNQGGSGARMHLVHSVEDVRARMAEDSAWAPDHVMLLQEYLPHGDTTVRMEFVGGEFLYAMKVRSSGDSFNLCPSEVCIPVRRRQANGAPAPGVPDRVEFDAFPDVPAEAVEIGKQICKLGQLDVAGIEYLETADGRRVFYDINANSNLRRPVAIEMGIEPFEKVVDYLLERVAQAKGTHGLDDVLPVTTSTDNLLPPQKQAAIDTGKAMALLVLLLAFVSSLMGSTQF
jgi:glutathione synthase/RimK-type ligase-like ATP-grasp enzyme